MNTPSLAEIQQWMKFRIRNSGENQIPDTLDSYLNPQGGEPGAQRLAVYAGGLLARTEEAFTEGYEAVRFVIGPSRFHELAHAYSRRYSSSHYNLSFIGRHLPEFLKEPALEDLVKDYPFLSDLAALEWRVAMAFHAFESEAMDPARLKEIALEDCQRIRFIFQPSAAVTDSAWPVLDIWQARKLSIQEVNIDLVNRPQSILIYRQGLKVQCELISKEGLCLLEKLISGAKLTDALEALTEMPGGESLPLSAWFSDWVQKGLFRGVEFA